MMRLRHIAVFAAAVAGAGDAQVQDVRATPAPYHWVPHRPSEQAMECLKYHKEGCSSIKDLETCLSSRDGTEEFKDKNGLYIHGEPCVWCGGNACRTGSTNNCEPYDFIVHGKGQAFDDYTAGATFEAAHCDRNAFSAADTQCLDWNRLGCDKITNMETCLSSKDGRDLTEMDGFKVGGQPCVWCGGACTDKSKDVCAPADWVLHGEGTAFQVFNAKESFMLAQCKDGEVVRVRPMSMPEVPPSVEISYPSTIPPWWRNKQPNEDATSCLTLREHGCSIIRDRDACLSSRDGRSEKTPRAGLELYGQPCVWCGGGICDDHATNLCEPWNYLMYGKSFDPDKSEFSTFHAKQVYTTATCKDGRVVPPDELEWGGKRPFWEPPEEPTPALMQCLFPLADGCSAATEIGDCLNSYDGSSVSQDDHGLKVHGQACVWCGGGPCTTNSTSVCEPFNYVMRGEGKAFDQFLAKFTYTVATCEEPADRIREVQQVEELTCLQYAVNSCGAIKDKDMCLASRDGSLDATYAGLKVHNQACVWCDGTACTSRNDNQCDPYDYAVNGQDRAYLANFRSAAWTVGMCMDGKPAIVPVPVGKDVTTTTTLFDFMAESVAEPYSQCGGEGWIGARKCSPDFVCKLMSAQFWQCLPGKSEAADGVAGAGEAGVSAGAVPPDALPPQASLPGRYVTDGSKVWWESPGQQTKHLLGSTADCAKCGCTGNIVLIKPEQMEGVDTGAPFTCSMVDGDGEDLGASPKGEDVARRSGRVGMISFMFGLVIMAVGAAVVGYYMGVCGGKDKKKRGVCVEEAAYGESDSELDSLHDYTENAADAEAPAPRPPQPARVVQPPAATPLLIAPMPAMAKPLVTPVVRAAPSEPVARLPPSEPVMRPPPPPSEPVAGFMQSAGAYGGSPYRSVTFTGRDAEMKSQAFMNPGASSGVGTPAGSAALVLEPVAWGGAGSAALSAAGGARGRAPPAPMEPIARETMRAGPRDVFDAIDQNHDGQITREEWNRYAFQAFDQNGDGVVSQQEWTAGRTPAPRP